MPEASSPLALAYKPLRNIDFNTSIIAEKSVKINENLSSLLSADCTRQFLSITSGYCGFAGNIIGHCLSFVIDD